MARANFQHAIIALLVLAFTPGCLTQRKRDTGGLDSTVPLEKAGSDDENAAPVDGEAVTDDKSGKPKAPSIGRQFAFIKTHTEPTASFGAPEHEFVRRLPRNPKHGGVTEAAIVIGLAKSILNPLTFDTPSFQETDLVNPQRNQKGPDPRLPSLENMAGEYQVDLIKALRANPLLTSYGAARMVLDAVNKGPNSGSFVNAVTATLQQRAALWQKLFRDMDTRGQEINDMSYQAPDTSVDAPPPSMADLKSGDNILVNAQAHADRGQFQEAIEIAARIPRNSPMHSSAQAKIREFSNRAVQDLRRKAARAFQSAIPITDAKVRAEYLREAKRYLEEAIAQFPEATQLPTVRDNLQVISRDLERLESEVDGQQEG